MINIFLKGDYSVSEIGLRPLAGKVFVEIEDRATSALGLDDEGKTAGGILVPPPEMQGVPNTGKVVAVGKDVTFPREGDRVIFTAQGNEGFKWQGHRLFRLNVEQISGVFK